MKLLPQLLFLFLLAFASNGDAVDLKGPMIQGGMVQGKVAPGTKISLEQRQIFVNEVGDFAFGFSRDEKTNVTLKIQKENQKEQLIQLKIKQRNYKIQKINGLPKEKVSPTKKEHLARIKADGILVRKARNIRSQKAYFSNRFIWPAAGRISGVYGSQRVLNGNPRRPHYGVDIANKIGSKIIAPAGGTVVLAEDDLYFSGGTIIIDHGGGIFSSFLHLSKVDVEVNQTIKQGEQIGLMGATGRVTGPHLDWRLNWFNVRLDPELIVSGKLLDKF